jgi:hypothetical protein
MEDRKALFERNLKAFELYFPYILPQLIAHVPATTLVDVGDDDFDIEFQGSTFFNGGAKAAAAKQMENYRPYGMRLTVHPPHTSSLDLVAGQYVARLLRGGVDAGMQFLAAPSTVESFHLVLFGVGLAQHIDPLLEITKARSVCLVEPNVECLWQSMHVYDWTPLLERNRENRHSVSFMIADDPIILSNHARQHCRYRSPVAIDWTFCFLHYNNAILQQAMQMFKRDAHLMISGLGFMVDEFEMIRATYHNLNSDGFKLYRQLRCDLRAPAFVVGSGPSLDAEFDFLRRQQNNAVIFACGTSVAALMANGIRPDFCLILENGDINYEIMSQINAQHDISDITLIASSTVSPLLKKVFKKIVYFQRSALSSYAVFGNPANVLAEAGPTVTNTGVHGALEMGFREIYLFGVDLGGRAAGRHHSVYSPYTQADAEVKLEQDLFEFEGALDRPLPGNFGGIVLADVNFVWSRDTMERMIERHRVGHTIYNCSDGLRIAGTIPKMSSSVKLKDDPDLKRRTLEQVDAGMEEWAPQRFTAMWGRQDWRKMVHDLLGDLRAIVSDEASDIPDLCSRMAVRLINDHERLPTFAEFFVRGSAFLTLLVTDYYTKRQMEPERQAEFAVIVRNELLETLRQMGDLVDVFFEKLPTAEKPFLHADVLTWVES